MKPALYPLMLMLAIAIALVSNAQKGQFKALKKGDIVPDISVTVHVGDSSYNTKLSNYKGKLLLLDFWGVHCLSCIASMPHMLELQNQFKNELQILFVTKDKNEEVNALWKKYDKSSTAKWVGASRHLSFINEDTIFTTLFPTKVQPTHVWIDSNQIVYSIAYSTSTTAENIQTFLGGKKIILAEQEFINLDLENPLSWFAEENSDYPLYYSFITKHFENGGEERSLKVKIDSTTKRVIGFSCLNSPIVDLYKLAYKEWMPSGRYIPDNRVIVESKSRERFFPANNNEKFDHQLWWDYNTFCYALRMPLSQSGQTYKTMQQDLDRFFNLRSKVEARKVKCFVLKRVSKDDRIHSRLLPEKYNSQSGKLIIHNMKMNQLFLSLYNVVDIQHPLLPFVDVTNYKEKIDIELPWKDNVKDIHISELRKSLQRYGLDVVEEYRSLDMLVIKDNEKK